MITENKSLSLDDFKQIVKNAPLFAIDFVIVNYENEVLLGQRLNAPAKGSWFVPGGRVYKSESLEDAFKRISKAEIGFEAKRNQTWLLGLYDHFYDDSFFNQAVSTHYINATHVMRLSADLLSLPKEQHSAYQWLSIEDLAQSKDVHQYSKIFLPELNRWIERHD